jgi:hypothetical protein
MADEAEIKEQVLAGAISIARNFLQAGRYEACVSILDGLLGGICSDSDFMFQALVLQGKAYVALNQVSFC